MANEAPDWNMCVLIGVVMVMMRCAPGLLLAAMTDNHDLLGQMRTQWRQQGRSSSSQISAREFVHRNNELALHGVRDLCDLVDALEPRSGRSIEQRAAIVRALLRDAADPQLHRALLQTLLPGIVSVCRQLQFGRGIVEDPSMALDEAISLASELLVDWAGQDRQYAAPDLLSALRGRLRRWLLKEKAARSSNELDASNVSARSDDDGLITRLNNYCGGPHDRLARLTYARVFEGQPWRDLAKADHSAPRALQQELQQFATKFLL